MKRAPHPHPCALTALACTLPRPPQSPLGPPLPGWLASAGCSALLSHPHTPPACLPACRRAIMGRLRSRRPWRTSCVRRLRRRCARMEQRQRCTSRWLRLRRSSAHCSWGSSSCWVCWRRGWQGQRSARLLRRCMGELTVELGTGFGRRRGQLHVAGSKKAVFLYAQQCRHAHSQRGPTHRCAS